MAHDLTQVRIADPACTAIARAEYTVVEKVGRLAGEVPAERADG